jgi:hemolysin activation/secretion protein
MSVAWISAMVLAVCAQDDPGQKGGGVDQSLTKPKPSSERPEKPKSSIRIPPTQDPGPQDEGPKIKVEEFKLRGNTIIPTPELEALVEPFEHKELTLREIKEVAKRITLRYREGGWVLSYAYLPPQDIKKEGGDVEIAIVEVKVDRVVVQGNQEYKTGFFLEYLQGLSEQPALRKDLLDRSLLLLNDYPGLSCSATLRPGSRPGTTDVCIDVRDASPTQLTLSGDNLGNDSISEYRFGAEIMWGNMWSGGHEISIRTVLGTEMDNLKFIMFGLRSPLDSNGLWLDASLGWMDYQVEGVTAPLEPTGKGGIFSIGFTYPYYREQDYTLTGQLGLSGREIEQYMLGVSTARDSLRVLYIGFEVDSVDGESGRTLFSAQLRQGLGTFLGGTSSSDEGSRADATNSFTKVAAEICRIQRLSDDAHVVLRMSAQYSADSLLVSEQIGLGGVDSIRGYNAFEYAGDWGYVATAELRLMPPFLGEMDDPFTGSGGKIEDAFQLVLFFDYGRVELHNPEVGESSDTDLFGAGVGVRVDYPDGSISLDVGWPLGDIDPRTGDSAMVYLQIAVGFGSALPAMEEPADR